MSYYSPPVVYSPVQRVAYYAAPTPTYTPAVAYYYAPPVSYAVAGGFLLHAACLLCGAAVSYYTPTVPVYAAPVSAVTTTRYGLLGRPRETTVYYYPR